MRDRRRTAAVHVHPLPPLHPARHPPNLILPPGDAGVMRIVPTQRHRLVTSFRRQTRRGRRRIVDRQRRTRRSPGAHPRRQFPKAQRQRLVVDVVVGARRDREPLRGLPLAKAHRPRAQVAHPVVLRFGRARRHRHRNRHPPVRRRSQLHDYPHLLPRLGRILGLAYHSLRPHHRVAAFDQRVTRRVIGHHQRSHRHRLDAVQLALARGQRHRKGRASPVAAAAGSDALLAVHVDHPVIVLGALQCCRVQSHRHRHRLRVIGLAPLVDHHQVAGAVRMGEGAQVKIRRIGHRVDKLRRIIT